MTTFSRAPSPKYFRGFAKGACPLAIQQKNLACQWLETVLNAISNSPTGSKNLTCWWSKLCLELHFIRAIKGHTILSNHVPGCVIPRVVGSKFHANFRIVCKLKMTAYFKCSINLVINKSIPCPVSIHVKLGPNWINNCWFVVNLRCLQCAGLSKWQKRVKLLYL